VAFAEFGLVAEPGGAARLAAVLAGKVPIEGRCVPVALTGVNVNPAAFGAAIRESIPRPAHAGHSVFKNIWNRFKVRGGWAAPFPL